MWVYVWVDVHMFVSAAGMMLTWSGMKTGAGALMERVLQGIVESSLEKKFSSNFVTIATPAWSTLSPGIQEQLNIQVRDVQ